LVKPLSFLLEDNNDVSTKYLLQEYMENGTFVKAHVPLPLARLLTPLRQQVAAVS
jgi:hypothetical protein